ncbi:hypothetical protein [Brevundimonas guildfordensis]|jgi:hypothetical protein|uniref:Uncharacterized protein n=1 Tax=Brevundimonas guildfordensis TaxID=2762241 RepID=A0ABR8QXK3_9CAUL|nr:hypothetical protein [Brevundimonas guildfordensis]MBD7940249.1 hypothetical protein [Brevundimonas guildfordensis]
MTTLPQFFCYVYDAPDRTPQMLALEADTFLEAIRETRRVMRGENGADVFAEIWDSSQLGGQVTRIEAPPGGAGLLRSIRRNRPFSRFSRP